MQEEPGTGWFVHPECNDGMFSLVEHPQNFPPENIVDDEGLENASPEEPLTTSGVWTPAMSLYNPKG